MKKKLFLYALLLTGSMLVNLRSMSQVTVTAATGWTTLCNTYVAQTGNIVITESAAKNEIQAAAGGTLILTAPTGYEFNPGTGSISFSGTSPGSADLTAISMVVSAASLTITFTTDGSNGKLDVITITGIEAKASVLTPPAASGSILRTVANPGTATVTGVTNGTTNFGTCTQTNFAFSSCTTVQSATTNVVQSSTNNKIINVNAVVAGNCGTIFISSFTFNTNGSNSPGTNITNAKLWYTGTSSVFAATIQVGATSVAPSGSFVINGFTQTLAQGTNYFWLSYDVPAGAVSGQVLDAECNSVTFSDVGAVVPTTQAPAGTRPIGVSTVTSIASGPWSTTTTWDCTCIPTSANHVIIATTHSITTTADIACVNLTINGTGRLSVGSYELDILGTGPSLGASLVTTCTSKLKIRDISGAAQFVFPTSVTVLNKLTLNRGAGATSNHNINLASCAPAADSIVLVLTDGVLYLTPSGTSKLLMSAITFGKAIQMDIPCSNSSYVDGIVSRSTTGTLNQMYSFPVGNNGVSRKFSVGGGADDVANEVQFFYAPPPNPTCIAAALTGGIIDDYYWTNTRASGTCQRRLHFEDSDFNLTAAQRSTDLTTADADMTTIPDPGCAIANTWSKSTGGQAIDDVANTLRFTGANASNSKYWTFGSVGVSIMPIELLSFTSKCINQTENLSWRTASEINNDYFTIEKTTDGIIFEVVGTVKGAGNSTAVLNYSFVDAYPNNEVSYYRLKQTDYDGKYTYSDLLTSVCKNENDFLFNIYPNPNDGEQFNVKINSNENNDVLVVLKDIYGNELYTKVFISSKNDNVVFAIDLGQKLNSGVYFISATSNQKIYNKRLIIQ